MHKFSKKLNYIARDTNLCLKKFFLTKNKYSYLIKPMKYGVFSGGKRFRSAITVHTGKIFNVDYKKLIFIGAAIECIHSYSLIHDDLPAMDNDKYRRGKKTTHYKYNEFIAILAGCGLLTKTYAGLSSKNFKLSDKTKIKLIQHLTNISGERGLLKGQYLDLSIKNKTTNERLEVNKLKTGKLMSYCCSSVGIASKKNRNTINRLSNIGLYIGEIFQINDDFEDYPKMRKDEKSILQAYKLKLYKKTINELKILKIKSRKIYLLLDFLMDLKV